MNFRTLVLMSSIALCKSGFAADDQEPITERSMLASPETIIGLMDAGLLNPVDMPDPHWREDACIACHTSREKAGFDNLRSKDINQLCNNCHEETGIESYIHSVGMEPSPPFQARMPADFKGAVGRGQGTITCISCHDLTLQCKQQHFEKQGTNPRFFRGGPYYSRTDLCFNCHEPDQYQRYNPHDQITDEGELDTERCYVCHSVTPNRRKAKTIDDVRFNVHEKLEQLCTGCHPRRDHPGGAWVRSGKQGPNHLRVPSEKILKRLKAHEAKHDIILPLEPDTGRIFCATCHNPHERGVQYQHKADKGADGVKRLRRGQFEVCMACHDK